MAIHLYLSLIPEALIASMLTPEEFGAYYAIGSEKKSRGQAIFFEIDPKFRGNGFQVDEAIKRCIPHDDGSPKQSIYIAVYRVLENVPLETIKCLYLTTQDGRTLAIEPSQNLPEVDEGLHLYREISPVTPLVVSSLAPRAFYELIVKNPTSLIKLPAICFMEMRLDDFAHDPEYAEAGDLPYANLEHLRSCLVGLRSKAVATKMVDRFPSSSFSFRTIKNGFFLGNVEKIIYFPFPDEKTLVDNYYRWWRSATM
jgi:hypothetical protein